VTKSPLWYKWEIIAPPESKLIVSDLALLTVPASRYLDSSALANVDTWNALLDGLAMSFGFNQAEMQVRATCRAVAAGM
jgi:hypothetical protein